MGQDNAELMAEAHAEFHDQIGNLIFEACQWDQYYFWDAATLVADRLVAELERVTPRGDDWEYGCSWLEGQERVYGIRDDEWTAKNDLHRMNLGYPYPEENYLVRRHSATSWEPFTPTGKETE